MVMAAGLGTRMRPLTDHMPKALVQVAGKPLIAYVIDPLIEAGVERVVVNVHAHADQLTAYLRGRRDAEFLVSDEREGLLETGGGVKHARALLGDDPIFVCNSDYVWRKPGAPALEAFVEAWDPARMDAAPGQGDVEIWTFDNRSGGWFHPIHVHLTDFKILDRNGQPPQPYEVGPKDVAYAGEGEVVRVIAKFGPRRGKYMMHCHNVIHEDHDMMTNFEVGTGGPDPVTAAPPKPVSQLPTTPLVKPPSTA